MIIEAHRRRLDGGKLLVFYEFLTMLKNNNENEEDMGNGDVRVEESAVKEA